MRKDKSAIQKEWFKALWEGRKLVSVHLLSGLRLKGRIVAFDAYSIRIKDDAHKTSVLIEKTSIATVVPGLVKMPMPIFKLKAQDRNAEQNQTAPPKKPVVIIRKKVRHLPEKL